MQQYQWRLNTLRSRQNGRHFADDIFKCIFLNEIIWISIKILKFVPRGPINNIPALVQMMTWRQSGDKPLSEPMMVSLVMYICLTWPQWVKAKQISPLLIQITGVTYLFHKAINMTNSISVWHLTLLLIKFRLRALQIPSSNYAN